LVQYKLKEIIWNIGDRVSMAKNQISVIIIAMFVLLSVQSILVPGPAEALNYGNNSSLSTAAASFYGEAANDYFSRMSISAGDVNGDGFDDILMSSVGTSKVYLFFGKASGWAMDINANMANASFVATAADDTGINGHGMCGADVNGDGLSDIILGMPMNDAAGTDRGQVYIIFGKKTGWKTGVSLTQSNASFRGEANGDWLGRSVGCGGDVNGDGIDDVIMAASVNDENGVDAGQTYLILGKKTGWAMNQSVSNADASFWGEAGGDSAGIDSAIAPDVNGDNLDDILIGAANNDRGGTQAGAAYLVLGMNTGWAMDMQLSNKANGSWFGEAVGDALGLKVTGLGDVNGDGLGDLMLGAYLNDYTSTDAGQAYIIFGQKQNWAARVNISTGMNASYVGEAAYDYAGRGVGLGGDVNGDGLNDIIIGGPQNDEAGVDSGEAYLILGKTSGWAKHVSLSLADSSWQGEGANCLAGRTLGGDGDFNGDGLDDLVISCHWNSEHGSYTGQGYVVFPDSNKVPTLVNVVKAYDKGYVKEISTALVNDTIYIQLNGTDQDGARRNLALVDITSNFSDPHGFRLPLLETGINTGTFQGNFTVKDRTYELARWLNASEGELVKIVAVSNLSANASVFIGKLDLVPHKDVTKATEDQPYSVKYSTMNGTPSKWTVSTNAGWLNWNSTSHTFLGTPDNSMVGSYSVKINVTNDWGSTDQHDFTIIVKNVPPTILNSDIKVITEGQQYVNDYSSDDDGQGTITWHLATNASWLHLNSTSGNLTGLPVNSDVGRYWANVSVDDGNLGWDFTNFTVNVTDLNAPPHITTTDILTAYEDQEYRVQYNATDIDLVKQVFTWSKTTTATWLHLNASSGLLNGTPTNDEVGKYNINITVSDGRGGSDSHVFELTVINVNDRPIITSVPNVTAWVGKLYNYQATASDIDAADVLEFSLGTVPTGMTIDKFTGLVSWTPTLPQNGTNHVIVKVSDGLVFVEQAFNITVLVPSANHPPVATLLSPTKDDTLDITNPGLSWSGTDGDNDTISYDVYLGLDKDKVSVRDTSVRRAVGISTTVYQAPELQRGSTYYWTVIPLDQEGPGDCLSGVWSFDISTSATVNEPPTITSQPILKGTVGKQYLYDVNATDKNPGDTLTYSLEKRPPTMSIDKRTGLIGWVPGPSDVGRSPVTVAVTDGKAFAKQSFTIVVTKEVILENKPPVLDTIVQQNATVGKAFSYLVVAHDPDPEDATNLTFSLEKNPAGMTIDAKTGKISWTPSKAQLGVQTVVVAVSDSKASVNNSFEIEVKEVTNPPPPVVDHNPWAGAWLWIIAALLAVIVGILLVLFIVVRRRKAAAEEEARRMAMKPRRHKGPVQGAPTKAGTIPAAIPVDETRGSKTKVEPGEVLTATTQVSIGRRTYSKSEIIEVLKALPHELPVLLLMKSTETAADEILSAEYKKNQDGHIILKLNDEWFYGDPKYLTKYLTAYIPEEVAGAPEAALAAHLEATTSEAEQRSVADEVMAKLDRPTEKPGPPPEDKSAKKKGKSAVSESELEDVHDDKNEKSPEKVQEEENTDIDTLIKDLEMK
jgi:hypothetical protein